MDALERLKTEVFGKQKVLAKICAKFGSASLLNYTEGWSISRPSDNSRKFFALARRQLIKIYPNTIVDEALAQVNQQPLVSTIDHHGVLNHPFFINSNLIYSQHSGLKYLLCLSTAGISLNNSSWPGCLLITGQDASLERFSFFRDKNKTQAVLATKAFALQDVLRVESQINSANFLSAGGRKRLLGLTREVFRDPGLLELKDFSAQASRISTALWQKTFPGAPKLLYLPLEGLIAEIILSEIIPEKGHILHKLFFTQSGWDALEKYFLGSLGAFSSEHKGSFLFWGIDAKGRRKRVARRAGNLFGAGFKSYQSVQEIANALSQKELYPTSLGCFLVLLYYGVTCLGGFNQVNWLTDIKEKFAGLLKELGEPELSAGVDLIPTENFAEGILALDLDRQGAVYKPSALDLFLKNDPEIQKKYRKLAASLTVSESMDSQLPEIYKVITPALLRSASLLKITEAEIVKSSGLADKVKTVFLA